MGKYTYKPQYGVIVICADEKEQKEIYERLLKEGLIADRAALEYAGLNMALDYVQNIANSKAEEKVLRDSLKTAKEDRDAGRMTDDAYRQFVETTEDAIRKNKVERAEAYFNLVGRLSDSRERASRTPRHSARWRKPA